MIRTHSNDSDVAAAAQTAAGIVSGVLNELPRADEFDYGGHELRLEEYDMCERCTQSIAEAQLAEKQLSLKAEQLIDPEVKEHVELVAKLFELESEIAIIRAELHSGQNSEQLLNMALGHIYNRAIHDRYDHTHSEVSP